MLTRDDLNDTIIYRATVLTENEKGGWDKGDMGLYDSLSLAKETLQGEYDEYSTPWEWTCTDYVWEVTRTLYGVKHRMLITGTRLYSKKG